MDKNPTLKAALDAVAEKLAAIPYPPEAEFLTREFGAVRARLEDAAARGVIPAEPVDAAAE